MGRSDNSAPMEGVAFPVRSNRVSQLRRMHTERSGSSGRQPSIPGDSAQHSRALFWDTVLNRPHPDHPSVANGSFHSGFSPSMGSTSAHVQPTQSFHVPQPMPAFVRSPSGRAHGSRRFTCDECDASYLSQADLNSHKERHHSRQPRPFQCPLCDVGFSQRSHLNQHVRTVHQKVRPHKCSQCDKAFGKKYDLYSHRDAVHANERPHACDLCDKKFAKRSNLTRHREKLHKDRGDQSRR